MNDIALFIYGLVVEALLDFADMTTGLGPPSSTLLDDVCADWAARARAAGWT